MKKKTFFLLLKHNMVSVRSNFETNKNNNNNNKKKHCSDFLI